ncbi:MAG: aminoglycoside 6-adenylyltransferase [Candidatus Sabulitectum sp.]|nr:aminoglycoside 6-adenylyltransferase [Candidatus Sabulitectum sp.]
MNITRQKIISTLHESLVSNPKILAMWLEGADATNTVDEYSDIDLCCSVKTGAIAEVMYHAQKTLENLNSLDLVETLDAGEDYRHTVFHLAGTSDYLLVDFNLFVDRGSSFIKADEIEKPLVLFDRGSVIQYLSQEEYLAKKKNSQRIQELRNTIAQSSRIEKYVKRGLFPEAYGYYQRWLLAPLIEILRMLYTPLHPDYHIVHISRHLPDDILMRLEELFKINSVTEIEAKSKEALLFFNETLAELNTNSQKGKESGVDPMDAILRG